jgi:hypothetical protein
MVGKRYVDDGFWWMPCEGAMEKVTRFVFTTMLLAIALIAFSICSWRIIATFISTDGFAVTSVHQVCEQPLNNRCVTHYVVIHKDGVQHDFLPFGYQFGPDYPREGMFYSKDRLGFSYSINGATEQWPYLWQHVAVLVLSITGLLGWYFAGGPRVIREWLKGFKA